nr:hypothetical protein [uncultured Brevundimonas sp.]
MPYDEAFADALTEIVFDDAVDEYDCYDRESLAAAVARRVDDPHHWVVMNHGQLHLMARGQMYRFGESNTLVSYMGFDFRGAILPGHPHAVSVDWDRREEAIQWAVENIGDGAFVEKPDGPAELVEFSWVTTWQGVGVAIQEPTGSGEFRGEAPEVFFFADKAKAALFRTFVG